MRENEERDGASGEREGADAMGWEEERHKGNEMTNFCICPERTCKKPRNKLCLWKILVKFQKRAAETAGDKKGSNCLFLSIR
jgi:hypothetical protein